MLSIYQAIVVDHEAIHSGSTKPSVMTLADKHGKIKGNYVVKVFKPNNLLQSGNTYKEVYGNILADAFDLNVPKVVLATVSQGIIDILNQSRKYKDFGLVKGTYFATGLMDKPFPEMVKVKEKYWEFIEIQKEDFERKHLFLDILPGTK